MSEAYVWVCGHSGGPMCESMCECVGIQAVEERDGEEGGSWHLLRPLVARL